MRSGYRLDGSSPMQKDSGEALAGRFFQQSSRATHTVALARQVVKVPSGIDADLMGPLGCSITTGADTVLNELKPRPNSSVAILGVSNVALAAVMAARLSPATRIIAIETDADRLTLARSLGATDTIEYGSRTNGLDQRANQRRAELRDRGDQWLQPSRGRGRSTGYLGCLHHGGRRQADRVCQAQPRRPAADGKDLDGRHGRRRSHARSPSRADASMPKAAFRSTGWSAAIPVWG